MKASVVTAHGGPQVMKNQDMPDSWAPPADKGSNDHKKNSMNQARVMGVAGAVQIHRADG
jgi:hypothetical protein